MAGKNELNKLWLETIERERIYENHTSVVRKSALFKGHFVTNDEPLEHPTYNLKEWIKFPWTLEQFLCLRHRYLVPYFLELNYKFSKHTTVAVNNVPCDPISRTTLNYSSKTTKQIEEDLDRFYPYELLKIKSCINNGEISDPAPPKKWLELCKKLNIELPPGV